MITVRKYVESDLEIWDTFLSKARNSDFMHSRKFLNYHGSKIIDASLMFYEADELVAVLPASVGNSKQVISHGGASYGGLCYLAKYGGERLVEIAKLAKEKFKQEGFETLIIKPKPSLYSEPAGSEDLYVWWRHSAEILRVDLSNVLEISRMEISKRRARALSKAILNFPNFEIKFGMETIPEAYKVCADNLMKHRNVQPVHELADLQYLAANFPEHLLSGHLVHNNETLAGIIFFNNDNASVVQYWGSNENGRRYNALDLLVMAAIEKIRETGITWFVPGISTSQYGQQVDQGIYEYKRSLGAGTISQPTLILKL